MAATYVYLQDSGSTIHRLGVTNNGLLQTNTGFTGTVIAPHLRDPARDVWLLGVNTSGLLTLTPVSEPLIFVDICGLVSPDGNGWGPFGINANGQLTLGDDGSVVVVGQLVGHLIYVVGAQQPGGIGTAVTDPTQTVNEATGRFRPGCGHSINNYEVLQQSYAGCPAVLVTCPICSFLQKIITPASALHDPENDLLLA